MEDESDLESSSNFLENEKRDDPVEIAKKQLELGKKFLKKIEDEEERQKARAAAPQNYLSHHGSSAPQVSTFVVRRIRNGFLVVGSGSYQFDPDPEGRALYCKDEAAVREAIKEILEAFLTKEPPCFAVGPETSPRVGSDVPEGT